MTRRCKSVNCNKIIPETGSQYCCENCYTRNYRYLKKKELGVEPHKYHRQCVYSGEWFFADHPAAVVKPEYRNQYKSAYAKSRNEKAKAEGVSPASPKRRDTMEGLAKTARIDYGEYDININDVGIFDW